MKIITVIILIPVGLLIRDHGSDLLIPYAKEKFMSWDCDISCWSLVQMVTVLNPWPHSSGHLLSLILVIWASQ